MAKKNNTTKEKKGLFGKRAIADHLPKKPAVSVDAMVDENKAATVSTDYQQYLRKLMKKAGGQA